MPRLTLMDQTIHTTGNESNLLLFLKVLLPNKHKYWVKSAKTQQQEITCWAASQSIVLESPIGTILMDCKKKLHVGLNHKVLSLIRRFLQFAWTAV